MTFTLELIIYCVLLILIMNLYTVVISSFSKKQWNIVN